MPGATTAASVADGARFDCVFDATGSAASMMRAFDFVAAGGRLVFVGLTLDPITFVDRSCHRREITLLASRNATPDDFARVIDAVVRRAIEPAAWITHTLTLDDVPAQVRRRSASDPDAGESRHHVRLAAAGGRGALAAPPAWR